MDPCTKIVWTWSSIDYLHESKLDSGWILLFAYTLTQIIISDVTIYVYGSN